MSKSADKLQSAYAIVRTGGKQYTVSVGQRISIEKLEGAIGDAVSFPEVLLVKSDAGDVKVGAPTINGAKVTGKIVGHARDKKVFSFRKRIKTGFIKKLGHRQSRTQVVIENIAA